MSENKINVMAKTAFKSFAKIKKKINNNLSMLFLELIVSVINDTEKSC